MRRALSSPLPRVVCSTPTGLPSREGERKAWQVVRHHEPDAGHSLHDSLTSAREAGVRYVLVGIPEDHGPQANLGRGGASGAWEAFLLHFYRLQVNRFFPADRVMVLGAITPPSRDGDDLAALRRAVEETDLAVAPVLHSIFSAGLEPVVIGGGHNNCYPILSALSHAKGTPVVASNLDPHADFRAVEGRHSGNGFRYAHTDGTLEDYHVMCLHEGKNNEASLVEMDNAGFTYDTYQALRVRKEVKFGAACVAARERLVKKDRPLGVELDTDCITGMPVSAFTAAGLSVEKAQQYVHSFASAPTASYLHLCEAAPVQHPQGEVQGAIEAGEILTSLAMAYISAREISKRV